MNSTATHIVPLQYSTSTVCGSVQGTTIHEKELHVLHGMLLYMAIRGTALGLLRTV